jgi:hypothetical protein
MLNKRQQHEKPSDYFVQFVGYSALISDRKSNADRASLDFVTGVASLFTDEGYLIVPTRPALSLAVALPSCVDEMKTLVGSVSPDNDGQGVKLRLGDARIGVDRGADVDRFVSELARRYRAIRPILNQAEKVGSEINRPPYADFIDEIEEDGTVRVVWYGNAVFVNGKLAYRPERRTLLMDARTLTGRNPRLAARLECGGPVARDFGRAG